MYDVARDVRKEVAGGCLRLRSWTVFESVLAHETVSRMLSLYLLQFDFSHHSFFKSHAIEEVEIPLTTIANGENGKLLQLEEVNGKDD